MLTYAVLVTFLFGMLCGAIVVILVALRMEKTEREDRRRRRIHPSSRDLKCSDPCLIDHEH